MVIHSIKNLGDAVKGRRLALGLTQEALAARAGVSRPWLSHLEAGKLTAEIGLVMRLIDALGLRLELVEQVGAGEAGASSVDLDALLADLHRR